MHVTHSTMPIDDDVIAGMTFAHTLLLSLPIGYLA
jgi:hypothetical protein